MSDVHEASKKLTASSHSVTALYDAWGEGEGEGEREREREREHEILDKEFP